MSTNDARFKGHTVEITGKIYPLRQPPRYYANKKHSIVSGKKVHTRILYSQTQIEEEALKQASNIF